MVENLKFEIRTPGIWFGIGHLSFRSKWPATKPKYSKSKTEQERHYRIDLFNWYIFLVRKL